MTHPSGAAITINGEQKPLALTLGALAEIEAALGGGDFDALKTRLAHPRVSDLVLILHALLGGGGANLTIEALKASDVDLNEAARAIAKAFEALAPPDTDAAMSGAPGKPQAPERQAAPETLDAGLSAAARKNGANGSSSP